MVMMGFRTLGMEGRGYKLWWSDKEDEVCGVRVMVKYELYKKVSEIKRVSDRVMAVVLVLAEGVLRLICAYVS